MAASGPSTLPPDTSAVAPQPPHFTTHPAPSAAAADTGSQIPPNPTPPAVATASTGAPAGAQAPPAPALPGGAGDPPAPASTAASGSRQDVALFRLAAGRKERIFFRTRKYKTLRARVEKAYLTHTAQYWFVAITSNTLLFLQILVAASLTALGAFDDRRARTATIFLGATNTVIAALITYFKTRNQPNRARQFRSELALVRNNLNDAEARFENPHYVGDVETVLDDIRWQFARARATAEKNYPDLWDKSGSEYDPFHPPHPDDPDSTPASRRRGWAGQGGQNPPPQPPPPGPGLGLVSGAAPGTPPTTTPGTAPAFPASARIGDNQARAGPSRRPIQ